MNLIYCQEEFFEPILTTNYDKPIFPKMDSNQSSYASYNQKDSSNLRQEQEINPTSENKNRLSKNLNIKRAKKLSVGSINLDEIKKIVNTENSIIDQRFLGKERNRKSEQAIQKTLSKKDIKKLLLKLADELIKKYNDSSVNLRDFYTGLGCCSYNDNTFGAYKESLCESVMNNTELFKKFPESNENRTLTYRVCFFVIFFYFYQVQNKLTEPIKRSF